MPNARVPDTWTLALTFNEDKKLTRTASFEPEAQKMPFRVYVDRSNRTVGPIDGNDRLLHLHKSKLNGCLEASF